MKRALKALFFTLCTFMLTQCGSQQAYEKLPELINEDTGLREFRFRSADCMDTVYQHVPSNCDHRQQIITERESDTGPERVLIRELTPDLREKFKTVVSPTVQYDEVNGKILVSATLRVNEGAARGFTEYKYTFEGDLKAFREKYQIDRSLRYIPLEKKTGPSEKLNGVVYCATQPSCDEVALVFSFLNPGPDGTELVDSKTFTIDGRESERTVTDSQPGQATQRTPEIQITEIQFPDEFGVDDIANPDNRDIFDNVRAPVLPIDPTGALCAGMVSDPTQCPDYIYDSTQTNPIHDTEPVDAEDAIVDVFKMDQEALGTNPPSEAEEESAPAEPSPTEETPTEPTPEENSTLEGSSPTQPNISEDAKSQAGSGAVEQGDRAQARPDGNQDQRTGGTVFVGDNYNNSNPSDTAETDTTITTPPSAAAPTAEEPEVQLPTENIPIPRPRPRPENLNVTPSAEAPTTPNATEATENLSPAEVLAQIPIDQIPRPVPRPAHLGQNTSNTAVAGRNQLLSVDGRFVFDLSRCSTQLQRLQTGVFNQARGIYHGGSLVNGKQYAKGFESNRPNTSRQSRQYSSDLTLLTVEYAACVLEQKYSNIKIDIHDFSLARGGRISGHGSHQNGLDVDLSYPHIGNRTSGFDAFVENMTDERTEVALDYAKILYSTERVHIIFTDTKVKNRFCAYMKGKGRLTTEYKNFINNNFRHIDGHHNHYHVRMKCNTQNEFCQPQGQIRTTKTCK